MEPIFCSFLRQRSIAASGNNPFFNWNIFFSRTFIPASGNEFFVYWKQYCFIRSFFLLVETTTETWGKSLVKDEIYSCQWTPVFSIFSEASFPYNGNAFFNKSFIRLVETFFLCSGNSVSCHSYFSACGSYYWN